jgi:hypothetical protein
MSATLPVLAAIAALAAPSGEGLFAGLCEDLRITVVAASERPAFASFAADPERMRRFGHGCGLSGNGDDRRLSCEWHVAPVTDDWERLNQAIGQCFPRALRMAEPEGHRTARFRFGTISIHISNRNFGFRGGSYVSLAVFRGPIH